MQALLAHHIFHVSGLGVKILFFVNVTDASSVCMRHGQVWQTHPLSHAECLSRSNNPAHEWNV
jgi:hypothetical protein